MTSEGGVFGSATSIVCEPLAHAEPLQACRLMVLLPAVAKLVENDLPLPEAGEPSLALHE